MMLGGTATAPVQLLRRLRLLPTEASPWEAVVARGLPPRGSEAEGSRILCATSVGGHPAARSIDSLVAMTLWLRGATPTFLLCDAALAACEQCSFATFRTPATFVREGPRRLCGSCFSTGASYYRPLPISLRRYREFLPDASAAVRRTMTLSLDECFSFEERGVRLGEQARAATLRFFGKADLTSEPPQLVLAVARRYAAGAFAAAEVAERVFSEVEPDCVVGHHGVYVPQGVLGEVARRDGVRVVNWGTAYRNTTVLYSHGDTYHHTFIHEPVELWDRTPLDAEQEKRLLEYLSDRTEGKGDWAWVTPEAALRPEVQAQRQLLAELELDPDRPVVGLLTNVLWDAQLYYENQAFPHMLEWLWLTLEHFAAHPELQLIVRIHPHEIKAGNRQPVEPEIRARYPVLPPNVRVIPHNHHYNTYALMGMCRAVLIYGTKTGVELSALGTPVIVAGEAWIRGKGISYDASSREEYVALLNAIPELGPIQGERLARARRYAHHYFFRRMIPLTSIDPSGEIPPRITIDRVEDLAQDRGLEVIVAGILNGREFVFDDS